jgi:hypothetical protein
VHSLPDEKNRGLQLAAIYFDLKASLCANSAGVSLMARLSSKLVKLLKDAAGLLGANTIGVLFIGPAAKEKQQDIGERARKKARNIGKKLVSNNRKATSHSRHA